MILFFKRIKCKGAFKLIEREKRARIWYLIKKAATKLGISNISDEAKNDYFEYMRLPNEAVRYLVIEHYNLNTGFYYHAYEESDLKDCSEQDKLQKIYDDYYSNEEGDMTYEPMLLIDIKTKKAYVLKKKSKYSKTQIT